jgi:S1-C subfamily serine protease
MRSRYIPFVPLFLAIICLGFFSLKRPGKSSDKISYYLDPIRSSLRDLKQDLRGLQADIKRCLEKGGEILRMQAHLDGINSRLNRLILVLEPEDIDRLYQDIIYPTVQVEGKDMIGAGTIIYSEKKQGGFFVYILTSYHVIKGSIRSRCVRIKVYEDDERWRGTTARIVLHDQDKDIALLKARLKRSPKKVAILATHERLKGLKVFTKVYTVGCPLGDRPTPTAGHISSLNKEMDGKRYWMTSAPTVFGNSGGGVFIKNSHELIGISSMVCTLEKPASTPVYHMSIVIPLDQIYKWLDHNGLQFLHKK